MKIKDITGFLESWAPTSLQESYDNSGLQAGYPDREIKHALICLDVTEEVIEEAIKLGCDMVISHHPVIFVGIKKLTGSNMVERILMKALKQDIALYAIHTNLDNIDSGVNEKISEIIGLKDCKILSPKADLLRKLSTFCPDVKLDDGNYAPDKVREALWDAGAGHIGNYDQCSFNQEGTGTFRALEGADPFIGKTNEFEQQDEIKIEVIYPVHAEKNLIRALQEAHPYEEVAFDIYPLGNYMSSIGSGMIGKLEKPMDEKEFLQMLKKNFGAEGIRYSPLRGEKIETVALCGGSGSFLLRNAIAQKADVFVTADFKYHQFFEAEGKILIADIGHYEIEQFTVDLLHTKLREKFSNFAFSKTQVNTNPVKYL